MEVGRNKVVKIDYTLKDENGKVLDTSEGREALAYVHGAGTIIPGLEEALNGKESGDEVSVSITPEKAYGDRNEDLVFSVEKDKFQDPDSISVGTQFQATVEGSQRIFTVAGLEGEKVVVDGNHPLAGMTLNFDVEVKDVRDASEGEIENKKVEEE